MNNTKSEEQLYQEKLDRHNDVMLTCINAAIKARNDHPNDPKAEIFLAATLNWYALPKTEEVN